MVREEGFSFNQLSKVLVWNTTFSIFNVANCFKDLLVIPAYYRTILRTPPTHPRDLGRPKSKKKVFHEKLIGSGSESLGGIYIFTDIVHNSFVLKKIRLPSLSSYHDIFLSYISFAFMSGWLAAVTIIGGPREANRITPPS